MSKTVRKEWLKKNNLKKPEESTYEFFYKPDNTNLLKNARNELEERTNRRREWQSVLSKDKKRKHKRIHGELKHNQPKHN